MLRRTPRSTRTDTLFPYTTLFRSRLPINLSGGLKAKGHPVGATGVSMHVMIARQLLGAAGDMQLQRRPELGLCLTLSGGPVSSAVSIHEPVQARSKERRVRVECCRPCILSVTQLYYTKKTTT